MSNIAVSNTLVTANHDHGIFLQPIAEVGAGAIFGSFNRVEANGNGITGIAIFGNQSGTTTTAIIVDSVANFNGINGFHVLSESSIGLIVDIHRSTAVNNGGGTNDIVVAGEFSNINVSESHIGRCSCITSFGNNSTFSGAPHCGPRINPPLPNR
jgi:hypothetical protein